MLKLFLTGTTTAATGKTVAITISKNGGAFANPNAGATNATEVANGWYKVTLDATDTNTLGDLVVRGTATSCDDTERFFGVVSATTGGLLSLPAIPAGARGGLPVSQLGQTGDGDTLSCGVTVVPTSRALVASDVWSITKAVIAALDPTTWGRFAYDQLRKIGTAGATVPGPVGTDDDGNSILYIRIRDDYTDENGQPIEVDLPEDWPDITGIELTAIHLGFGPLEGDATVDVTASEIVASGPSVTQTVKFEPRQASSTLLPPGDDWGTTLLVVYGPGSNRRSANFGLHVDRSYVP